MIDGLKSMLNTGIVRLLYKSPDNNGICGWDYQEDKNMDIGKIIGAILAGLSAYSTAAVDKEITVNEALQVVSTILRDSGIGDQKFFSLKK